MPSWLAFFAGAQDKGGDGIWLAVKGVLGIRMFGRDSNLWE
jgi:hypothetical protein